MVLNFYYHNSLILFITGWLAFVLIKTLVEIIPL